MKFLAGSTLQKVLAALVAAIMSFSILTPAIKKPATNPKPTGIVHNVKKVDGKIVSNGPQIKEEQGIEVPDVAVPDDYDEDEDYTPQATEETPTAPAPVEEEDVPEETPEAPAPQAQEEAPAEEPAPEEEAAPQAVAQWDVSAAEEDDVHMYFFADDSFLDEIAGAVRALFVPMTAYAAENEEEAAAAPERGTIYVDGEGSIESLAFLNFVRDFKALARDYEAWAEDNGYREDELYVAMENINEKSEIIGEEISSYEAHALSRVDGKLDYEYMIRHYFPTYLIDMVVDVENFWETYGIVAPTRIIIDGDIDTINYAAFAFLSSVRTIEFRGTVDVIGDGAFAGTNIAEVRIPEGTIAINDTAFANCHKLADVYLPTTIQEIGKWNFTEMTDDSVIHCPNAAVRDLLVDPADMMTPSEAGAVQADLHANYDSNRTTRVIG